MSENGVAPAPPDDDRTPTQGEDIAPPAIAIEGWVMPQPVFRRSEGHTPRTAFVGNEDATVTPDDAPEAEPADLSADNGKPVLDVADQPELQEELEPAVLPAAEPNVTETRKKRGWFRIVLIVLGIALLIAAATVVILVVALGYFLRVSESQNLN
jgi:hypothetical protein